MDSIFIVFACEKVENKILPNGKLSGFPSYGINQIVGYFNNQDDAENAVLTNSEKIDNEELYRYICIEEIIEGILNVGEYIQWYELDEDTKTYYAIETPDVEIDIKGHIFR